MDRLALARSIRTCFALSALALGSACGGGGSGAPASGFTLSLAPANTASVTAGKSAQSTVTIASSNGYAGAVKLACSIATSAEPPPSCSLSTSAVTLTSGGSSNSTLTVTTASGTPGGTYTVSISASGTNNSAESQTLTLTVAAVIERVVVIFQENRSTDNLFHDPVLIARGADIASSGMNTLGQTITLTPIDLGTTGADPQDYDLGHGHPDFVNMYDGGKMDGANLVGCIEQETPTVINCPPGSHPNWSFKYVNPDDVQPYFALAEQYTFADRMFQTNEGPSFPAHQFILAGTSAPSAGSALFASENPYIAGGGPVGCIAPAGMTVTMINPLGSETAAPAEYPCFDHPTLTDLLEADGLTWRYYAPSAGSIWTAPDAIEHICQQQTVKGKLVCEGPEWTQNVVIPQSQILTDIANGQLAQVTWVIPNGLSSDHALSNDGSGPSWVASVVNAIGNSPFWANTAIIITWDDWGGWYDHVAPKVIDDGTSWGSGYVYGFRVPMVVVSPYAKSQYISHVTHDFGSILKFIETTFKLPSLGYADAPADDLSDCFDLTQSPISFHTVPAQLNAAFFINDKRPPTDPDDD